MKNFICKTCGVQFRETETPPSHCPICEDERQYVGREGQQWTTLTQLQQNHKNEIKQLEPNLYGIGTTPNFAIGQRALLLQTPEGNVLWDCISLLDEETITAVNKLGGIQAIAISHPHFYDSMVAWAHAFDAPIYLHASDQQYVMRPDPAIQYWEGKSKKLFGNITLINAGGHFEGSTILHWPDGAAGKGAIFTGDTIMVVADRRYVSFMGSYPNLIPLAAKKVENIVTAVDPYPFDRLYAAWWDLVVERDAKTAVSHSAQRYIKALQ